MATMHQYKSIRSEYSDELTSEVNRHARQGWRLVSVIVQPTGFDEDGVPQSRLVAFLEEIIEHDIDLG